MNDSEIYSLVEKFANESSIAIGGNMKVTMNVCFTHIEPKVEGGTFRFEDANYLKENIDGALAFMFYLERNRYKVVKDKVSKTKRRLK